MELPSWDALVAFEAVSRHNSFTRAARELHVTQSAVSHRVRGLEEQLGYALFMRSTRQVVLTHAGGILAEGVVRGMAAVRDALRQNDEDRGHTALSVSCSPSFAIRWLVRNLHHFRAIAPHVAVRIAAADELMNPGHDGIDVCIRYGAGTYRGAAVTRLSHEEVFAVASPALLSHTPLTREADIVDHVLIHHDVMRDHPEHMPWARWLSPRVSRHIDPTGGLHFSHAHMALEAALAGQGVALGRTSLVANDLARGRLVAPLRRRRESGLAYWFLSQPQSHDDARVTTFREWLVSALA